MSRGVGVDFMKLLQQERQKKKQEKEGGGGGGQDQLQASKRHWGAEGKHHGLVMRGCSEDESQKWAAQGKCPQGAQHPTGYSLHGDFYETDADWESAIKTSIAFARSLKSEAILIAKECGLPPPQTADTYNYNFRTTLRKKNIPGDAKYGGHFLLAGKSDDEAAAWVIAELGKLHAAVSKASDDEKKSNVD